MSIVWSVQGPLLALMVTLGISASVEASSDAQGDCDRLTEAQDPACAVLGSGSQEVPPLESGPPYPPGADLEQRPGGAAEVPTGEDARPEPGGPSELLPDEQREIIRRRTEQEDREMEGRP